MSRWSATVKSLARSIRRLVIVPRGMVERMVAPCNIPGNFRSSMYFAAPVTLASPSLRRTFVPTALGTLRTVRTSGTFVLTAGHARDDLDDVAVANFAGVNRVKKNLVVHRDVVQGIIELFVEAWFQPLQRLQ